MKNQLWIRSPRAIFSALVDFDFVTYFKINKYLEKNKIKLVQSKLRMSMWIELYRVQHDNWITCVWVHWLAPNSTQINTWSEQDYVDVIKWIEEWWTVRWTVHLYFTFLKFYELSTRLKPWVRRDQRSYH